MSRARRKELLRCSSHSEDETLPTDKVLSPKNGHLKTILLSDILLKGRNLRTWQQATDCLNYCLIYMKGMALIHPCMYALLVKRCIACIKTCHCVINLTVTKWKKRLKSDMVQPMLPTGAYVHSDYKAWHGGAQPPLPHPRVGVG